MEQQRKYYKHDLDRMTVYQLREIARREKIIPAIVNPLDKELLIHTILRYRGAETALLINEYHAENYKRLEEIFHHITFQNKQIDLECNARIEVWQGLSTKFFDKITIRNIQELKGTNAFIVDNDKNLCCLFNVEEKTNDNNYLYLCRNRTFPCHEAKVKKYTLVLLQRIYSEQFFNYYSGESNIIQENIPAYCLQLLDFKVNEPELLQMPVAIDFGTSTTTAGVLDFKDKIRVAKLHNEKIKYATFYDNRGLETNLIPTLIGVQSLENPEVPKYNFGYEALKLAKYMDEGFTLFYDIKRWIADYDKEEELTDNVGRRVFVKRKNILREFFIYVIHSLEDYVKGKIRYVHFSSPVKQKRKFYQLFQDILPEYAIEKKEMIDESVAVLYNVISEMIESGGVENNQLRNALVIDCGGGTTDISSCSFKVNNRRVSYAIDIETGYENGSTDFGGNNLTYRILQILKLRIIEALNKQFTDQQSQSINRARRDFYGQKESFDRWAQGIASSIPPLKMLLREFNMDVFRYVDENGTESIYRKFERAYAQAEELLPTRYKDWETRNRNEYFQVRNNYYFLFDMADKIKREFFKDYGTLRVLLSIEGNSDKPNRNWELNRQYIYDFDDTVVIPMDKWKLTLQNSKGLTVINDLPDISLSIFEIEPILKPDIYNIVQRLLNPLYESGELDDYNLIKLSGQSCKIELFRTALKEFVPGKLIKSKPKPNIIDRNELKMACIDGALKYLRDKKFGYADISIKNREPHLPYILTGFTHTGKEVILIDSDVKHSGVLSRNIEDLTLTVYLKDNENNFRQELVYQCTLEEFAAKKQEEIEAVYGENIPQDETDTIVNREVKFFIWAEPQDWGFVIVPVYRNDEILYIGKENFYNFEDDQWIKNFFDGYK